MAAKVKEITYGQLMEMVRTNTQPEEIRTATATYKWDGLNYYRNDGEYDHIYTKSPLTKYSQKYLSGMKFTYDVPVLDDVEKEYLGNIVKPFREYDLSIRKYDESTIGKEWIVISGHNLDFKATFPMFPKGKMYKGMEVNKRYTLEELGL